MTSIIPVELLGHINKPENDAHKSEEILTGDLKSTLNTILTELIELFAPNREVSAAIYTFSNELGFQDPTVIGPLSSYLQNTSPREQGTAAYVVKYQTPVFVGNIDKIIHNPQSVAWPELSIKAIEAGIKAYANIPLIVEKSREKIVIGILIINFLKSHIFTEEQKESLTKYSLSAAEKIHLAQTQQDKLFREERSRNESEIWREISNTFGDEASLRGTCNRLLEEIKDIIDYDRAAFQIIVKKTRFQLAGAGFSTQQDLPTWIEKNIHEDILITRVIESGQPLIIPDTKTDSRFGSGNLPKVNSWAAVPLYYAGNVIGLITLDHETPNHFKTLLNRLDEIRGFADYAARSIIFIHRDSNLEIRIKELELISGVLQQISQRITTHAILQDIVEIVVQHLHCNHCAYFEPTTDEKWLQSVKSYDRRSQAREVTRKFKLGGVGIANLVFSTKKALRLSNARTHPAFVPSNSEHEGPLSMLVVPVKIDQHIIGVISADHDAYGWFSPQHERFLLTLSEIAGVSIARAEGFQLLKQISDNIANLSSTKELLQNVIEGALQLTNCDSGVIFLTDTQTNAISNSFAYPLQTAHPKPRLAEERGMTYRIMSEMRTIVELDLSKATDVQEEIREQYTTSIGIPLIFKSNLLGVLYLNSIKRREFSEREISFLETLATSAAIGLSNSRQYDLVNKELAKMQDIAIRHSLAGEMIHKINNVAASIPYWVSQMRERLVESQLSGVELTQTKADFANYLSKIDWDAEQILQLGERFTLPVEETMLDLGEILEDIRRQVKIDFENVEIQLTIADDVPKIWGIESNTRSAFWNIVINGIESMNASGLLVINVSSENNQVLVEIVDRGKGFSIPKEQIFDLFVGERRPGHLGYGLWYSNFVITTLGGTITPTKSDSNGSIFTISLPGETSHVQK